MDLRFSKAVQSVVQLERSPTGELIPTLLHTRKKKGKKKGTAALRPLEALTRKIAGAEQTFAETYEKKHNKSKQKTRDGWLLDLGKNTFAAARKAAKNKLRG